MSINDLLIDMGPDIYYDPNFRNVLEDHMTFLRTHPKTALFTLTPDEAYQWRGDLFGLLLAKNRPAQFHWLIMRLNNYTSPTQFKQDTIGLIEPDYTVVDKIRQSNNSSGRIS
jgi:hypothetical protein